MKIFMKALVLVFALSSVSYAAHEGGGKKLDQGMYIGSGVLGTLVGFGTGHILQERWSEKGWIFTVGEGVGLALMITGWVVAAAGAVGAATAGNPGGAVAAWGTGAFVSLGGYLVFAGFRIWDIVDIWGEPLWNHRLAENSFGNMGKNAELSNTPQLTGAVAGLKFTW